MQKQRLQIMVDWRQYETIIEIMKDNNLRNESQAIHLLIEEYGNFDAKMFKMTTEYKKLEDKLKNIEYELRQKRKNIVMEAYE